MPMTVFATPTVNGYKRYRPYSFAPDRVCWAVENRGALIRVQGAPGDANSHVENRMGEPAANPYLYMAANIAAGLDGMRRKAEPPPPVEADPYATEAPMLPTSLAAAVGALDKDSFFRKAFGDTLVDYLLQMKRAELAGTRPPSPRTRPPTGRTSATGRCASTSSSSDREPAPMTVQHIVLFSFPRELTAEEAADMRAMVASWPKEIGADDQVPVRHRPHRARTRGYPYLLYTEFPDVETLTAYRPTRCTSEFLAWIVERDCTPLAFDYHLDGQTVLMPE